MHHYIQSNLFSVVLVYNSLLHFVLFAISTIVIENAEMLSWIASTVLTHNHNTLSHPLNGDPKPPGYYLLHSTFKQYHINDDLIVEL